MPRHVTHLWLAKRRMAHSCMLVAILLNVGMVTGPCRHRLKTGRVARPATQWRHGGSRGSDGLVGILWRLLEGAAERLGHLEPHRLERARRVHQLGRPSATRFARRVPRSRNRHAAMARAAMGHGSHAAPRNQKQHGQPIAGDRRPEHLRIFRQRRRVLPRFFGPASLAALAGGRVRRVRKPVCRLQLAAARQ